MVLLAHFPRRLILSFCVNGFSVWPSIPTLADCFYTEINRQTFYDSQKTETITLPADYIAFAVFGDMTGRCGTFHFFLETDRWFIHCLKAVNEFSSESVPKMFICQWVKVSTLLFTYILHMRSIHDRLFMQKSTVRGHCIRCWIVYITPLLAIDMTVTTNTRCLFTGISLLFIDYI